jgi:tetratricopeptide (TPR) repeat protein
MKLPEIIKEKSNKNYSSLSQEYCIKGTLTADKGNLNEALEIYNKAVRANPKNHVAYYNRATIKIDLGDIEGARSDFFNFDKLMKYYIR